MMLQFFRDIRHSFRMPLRIFQIPLQPLQRYTHHIAMMQLRIKLALRQLQPQAMQPVQILWPQSRGMRAQIHEERLPLRRNHFE